MEAKCPVFAAVLLETETWADLTPDLYKRRRPRQWRFVSGLTMPIHSDIARSRITSTCKAGLCILLMTFCHYFEGCGSDTHVRQPLFPVFRVGQECPTSFLSDKSVRLTDC